MPIKVLVVDDSAFMRKVISDCIEKIDGVEVCGIARSGEDALRVIPTKRPDLVTLDIEMPGLNGLETLVKIKSLYNLPVIMLSSHSGEDTTIESLELGARDFIEKPQNLKEISASFIAELGRKIKLVDVNPVIKQPVKASKSLGLAANHQPGPFPTQLKSIVIGASTGGPRALMSLIKEIPANLAIPIFIVQHMPAGFTKSFARRLDQEAAVKVVEASAGMAIQPGVVYVAPGEYHMKLEQGLIVLDDQTPKIHGVRPAVDLLFESAAKVYGNQLAAMILTGMGGDGTPGLKAIKEAGGYTFAQDEASCVVFGMPRRAIEANVIDEIGNLTELGAKLNWMIRVKQ